MLLAAWWVWGTVVRGTLMFFVVWLEVDGPQACCVAALAFDNDVIVAVKDVDVTRTRRCFHQFCNNKTEQIHRLVIDVFLRKRAYFCCTTCSKAGMHMAVGIDSVGYKEYFKELYDEVRINISVATTMYYQQNHSKQPAFML